MRRLAALGVKFIGEQDADTEARPDARRRWRIFARRSTKSKKVNVWVQIHAVSPQSMMAAVDAGVPKLVHTPHFGWLSFDDAKRVAAAGVKQLSTIGFGVPVFGVFADDNTPRFRDGGAGPNRFSTATDADRRPATRRSTRGRRGMPASSTATAPTRTTHPKAGLEHELKSLNLMFSMQDVVKLMGPNTASYIEMSNDLGTLEAGKLADIVLLAGSPLDGYWNFLNTKVVIKGGVVVSDQR